MAQDKYRYFRPEARELLEQFAQGVLELEKNGSSAGAVQRLLRLAHTLKGAARVVRQSAIAERAHAIEDALAPFRDRADGIARETIDAILAHLDAIGSQIAALAMAGAGDNGHDKSAAAATAQPVAVHDGAAVLPLPETGRVIRADIADLDAVLDGVAETQARLNGLSRNLDTIDHVSHLADLLRAHVASPGMGGRGGPGTGGPSRAIAEELCRKIGSLANTFATAMAQTDRELRQLRDAAEALRLVAADSVLMALRRTARDGARALSKQVVFEAIGGDIRLDADVLGIVQSALIQIVRNAVAHGIETENERAAAGKPVAGRITVEVSQRGAKILFRCSDDGRGIDLAAVRDAAVQRGLLDPGGDFTSDDLVRVLLHGRISTSAAVTDVAGRGVGLDVVRDTLERVGGEVAVCTEPGRGTRFELAIPRSVTAVLALLVEAAPQCGALALPLDGVRRIVRLAAGDIGSASAGASVLYDGQAMPFIPLASAIDGTPWSASKACTAVIVAGADGSLAAIGVERLLGTARPVVRALPAGLVASAVVLGASLDGEGNPQLMLDPDALVAAANSAQRGGRIAPADAAAKRPVLVVDDSLTTRMLEKSILESAGYNVEVASSGEEGLDLVRRKPFALILCDVEMPGIDGFTFVERLRADAALRDIPAILVSSRCAPQDRQRGHDVGARGYIVKSEFNQAELLTMIRPMVG